MAERRRRSMAKYQRGGSVMAKITASVSSVSAESGSVENNGKRKWQRHHETRRISSIMG